MQKRKAQLLTIAASVCLPVAIVVGSVSVHAGPPPSAHPPSQPAHKASAASLPSNASAPQDRNFVQTEGDMTAKTRLFGPIGPGLRAVRRSADGRTYILASPSPGLVVYDAKGKQVFAITESAAVPGAKPSTAGITFGEDCDIDSEGRTYVADRGSSMIDIIGPDGTFANSFDAPSPVSIAWLGDGEIAVATFREDHLVIVYDKRGHVTRDFGDPEQISDRDDLNRFLNIGELATDAAHHIYYGFSYMPEPTVRQFDRNGYSAGPDVQYVAVEAAPQAQAIRREIVKQEKNHKSPSFKRILTGVGVDPINGEVWMAVGNTLLHFDKDGNRRASYQMYTPEGARLEANIIVVEPDRMIIGGDPIGIYEFARPDKKIPASK
jgi:hypothetical protein